MPPDGYRVGVLGATGAVGSTMLQVLGERGFPAAEVVAFASERSAGRKLALDGRELECRPLSGETIQGLDLVLSSAGGEVSAEWAPKLVEAGAVVVDNTSYWRMHDEVPLVVAEVNPEALDAHRGIVANPNCSAMQMVVALAPIHRAVGIERIVVSTYQPVSGTGRRAMQELRDQAHAVLHDTEPPAAEVYPHRIAFNVLPQVETFKGGDDYTTEERKMMAETRKILGVGEEELRISATCVRVPVLYGESESVNVQTREPLSPEECRELLARAPGRGGGRRARGGGLPAGQRRRRPRRGAGGPHPPRPLARALPQPLGGRRQPAQGSGDERRPGRRAAPRARPDPPHRGAGARVGGPPTGAHLRSAPLLGPMHPSRC